MQSFLAVDKYFVVDLVVRKYDQKGKSRERYVLIKLLIFLDEDEESEIAMGITKEDQYAGNKVAKVLEKLKKSGLDKTTVYIIVIFSRS